MSVLPNSATFPQLVCGYASSCGKMTKLLKHSSLYACLQTVISLQRIVLSFSLLFYWKPAQQQDGCNFGKDPCTRSCGKQRIANLCTNEQTVEQVLKIMAENGITAVPVVSGTEQRTSQVGIPIARSTHYIGIVSIFDVVLHIGENLGDAENSLQTPVANIIGQTNESRLLWTVDPNTKLIDAMQFLCKGVHRFLVPVQVHHETPYPHETTQHRLLTQTDVVGFLLLHLDEMGPCVTRSVSELGLLDPNLVALAVPSNMILMTALRLMHHKPVFSSFAVIEPQEEEASSDTYPSWGSGGKLVGSLSATHFRGMGYEDIKMLTPEMTISEFFKMLASKDLTRPLVTVHPNASLTSVMGAAITNKVHRVWVTDDNGWLMGVVSFSDIIGAVRRSPTSFVER